VGKKNNYIKIQFSKSQERQKNKEGKEGKEGKNNKKGFYEQFKNKIKNRDEKKNNSNLKTNNSYYKNLTIKQQVEDFRDNKHIMKLTLNDDLACNLVKRCEERGNKNTKKDYIAIVDLFISEGKIGTDMGKRVIKLAVDKGGLKEQDIKGSIFAKQFIRKIYNQNNSTQLCL
jgi:hypothetical protein